MKRAVIVHCFGGSSNYAWYPWVKKELEEQGYEVAVPDMPDTEKPALSKWLPRLQNVIGTPDEELMLIGHSLGNATIMRYLETLDDNQRVGKVVMVAGFTDDLSIKELENFFETPLDFEKIKAGSKNGFVAIQSDNDPYVTAKYGKILQEKLGAKLVIKHAAKHMSGPVDDGDSCLELPEVIENL